MGLSAPRDAGAELLALRAWYLVYFAGQYSQNFLPLLFAQTMSFTPAQIGGLVALRRIMTLACAPIFTFICDQTYLHRPLLTLALALHYTLCVVLSAQRNLFSVSVVLAFREMCKAGADATVNSAAVATLAEVGGDATYGSLRLYGSIGWGAMSFIGSVLLDAFFHSDMRFTLYSQAAIGIVVVFLVARVLNLSPCLFSAATERRRTAAAEAAAKSAENDVPIVENAEWAAAAVMFAANVLMVGFCASMLQTSLFLYATSLNIANSVLGLSVMLNCAVEAICFRLHGLICNAIGGPDVALRLAIIVNSVYLFALSSISRAPNPSAAYVACLTFGGVNFALFWASAVQICAKLAPPGKETSAQGALSSLTWGFGGALGCLAAGAGMQTIGTPLMYVCVSCMQISVLALPLAVWEAVRRLRRRNSYTAIAD